MSFNTNFTERPWDRWHIANFLSMSRPYAAGAFAEIDITDTLDKIKHCQRESGIAISLHGVSLYYFVQAAILHPLTLTYRYRNRLITFEDVNVSTPILQRNPNVHDQRSLTRYTFRSAQTKSMAEIQWELRNAMRSPPAQNQQNFGFFQRFARRYHCWRMYYNPFLFNELMGNLIITNVQSSGLKVPFNVVSPSPYTMGIIIGSVSEHVRLDREGKPIVRKLLNISGIADHAVIDGFPISRFSVTLSDLFESGVGLDADFIDEIKHLYKSS
jgi:hypothetical protein